MGYCPKQQNSQLLTGASKSINHNYDKKLKKHANKLIFNKTYTSEPTTVKDILPHDNVVAPTTAMVEDRDSTMQGGSFQPHGLFKTQSC